VKRLHTGRLQSLAEEVLGALPQIQAASAERFEEDRFRREGEAVLRAEMRATRIAGIFRPMVDLLELVGALVVLATGVWALTEGRLTLGALLAFLTYLTQLYSPVRHLGDLMLTGHRAAAGAERVAEILDEPPLVADVAASGEDVPPVGGMVSLNEVSYSYPGARQPALVDISLHLWPGTVTAIVGDSGAGKSTLVALLLRLIDPDKGVVRIGDEDLRHLPLRHVRSSIGVLFQDTYLFDGTVADNVAYGGNGDACTVASALDQADATEFVERLVGAADHQIGPKGRSLSGGQRRRLALARLLHADPPVLVLDEFSAGLDRVSAARILDVVRAPHRTVLLITHDLEVAAAADRVVSIHRGRLVSADSPILVGSG
jgi:ABC-type multidrug transport system fused ATPase/permease subunit